MFMAFAFSLLDVLILFPFLCVKEWSVLLSFKSTSNRAQVFLLVCKVRGRLVLGKPTLNIAESIDAT